jgi:hypothetical protein
LGAIPAVSLSKSSHRGKSAQATAPPSAAPLPVPDDVRLDDPVDPPPVDDDPPWVEPEPEWLPELLDPFPPPPADVLCEPESDDGLVVAHAAASPHAPNASQGPTRVIRARARRSEREKESMGGRTLS